MRQPCDITICSLHEALSLTENLPNTYNILSIMNPGNSIMLSTTKKLLYLEFHDIVPEDVQNNVGNKKLILPSKKHCKQSLNFLQKSDISLVHCFAGKRRSTAIVLGYLLSEYKDYEKAIDILYELRPCADPNPYVLKLMCDILNKSEDDYLTILANVAFKKWNK